MEIPSIYQYSHTDEAGNVSPYSKDKIKSLKHDSSNIRTNAPRKCPTFGQTPKTVFQALGNAILQFGDGRIAGFIQLIANRLNLIVEEAVAMRQNSIVSYKIKFSPQHQHH